MLAIDTNLIVRYLVADDPDQAIRARNLIDAQDVFICTTVMLETEWVLRSVYGFSAIQCARALTDFAGLPHVTLEDTVAVAKALRWVRQGMDFADGLHLAKAETCDAFVSFDLAFIKAATTLSVIKVRAPD
jgi:predicted nucleic-acid-binding protein